jgi:putative tricarboxylic transport membrane protein
MRRADLLGGIGLLLFAAFYFERSFAISTGLASDRLGPTFFPRILASVLALLAAVLIVRALSDRSDRAPLSAVRAARLFGVLALTAIWALLLPRAGFLLVTPLLLGSVMWTMGLRRWRGLIGVSLGMTLVLYLVFVRALKVLLPMGPLGGLG